MASRFMNFNNAIMGILMKSPLHGMLDSSTILVEWTGKKSGRAYATPVNFIDAGKNRLLVTSLRSRTWWKNFRGGTETTIWYKGKVVKALVNVIERSPQDIIALTEVASLSPQFAKYLHVTMSASGNPSPESVAEAAKTRIIVEFKIHD